MTTELTKAAQQALKPHQIAQLVNKLRDIACEFHAHDCLRELISQEVNSALTQRPAAQTDREAFEAWWKGDLVDWRGHASVSAGHAWAAWQARASLPAAHQATKEPSK